MTEKLEIQLRLPNLEEGKPVHELIQRCPPLDVNSSYNYFLLCSHFRDTCVVAEANDRIVGFLSAYLIPGRAETLFVWQVAVDEAARGHGLAGRMLEHVMARPFCADVHTLETTISPSNLPSRRVFQHYAEKVGAQSSEETFIEVHHFGGEAHEEERLIRIGPWK
ncbi:MAG: diaminobutyrate acetyltransferase [Gammaproteobacteria bacterium]|nr:diaminobutyrate acetyltransferase [Gammaproteobacteria bacterium]MCW8840042.1 diaminobutyrate acetyltransferase [Gammaproteobacteria bacterium]MCW8927528.1 diaminobutyrate acetyltransferase [Gammaproteobacteria bacterium]MCW8958626.1 diaminobutyrate acetyltransferase [Gammaproteobacteria bacterium]MCW8972969.1 diaminobutyrate acetyltransferase [Gammaproteobacteria bacterium]